MEKGEPIVVVKEISKSYGKVEALKEVSFAVEQGEVFGLIGPDGAGKSTLFRILTTLLLADKGTATVNGLDVVTDGLSLLIDEMKTTGIHGFYYAALGGEANMLSREEFDEVIK